MIQFEKVSIGTESLALAVYLETFNARINQGKSVETAYSDAQEAVKYIRKMTEESTND